MSDIPFINQLGNNLEAAIVRSGANRPTPARRRHRAVLIAAAAAFLAMTSFAVARILDDQTTPAAASVACYDARGNVSVIWPAGNAPVEVCAQTLRAEGTAATPLVACESSSGVQVFPGSGVAQCTARHLKPLPATYAIAHQRVIALERDLRRLERGSDCRPVSTMITNVQRVLDRTGWSGWNATAASGFATTGPCGHVGDTGGNGVWSIAGALDSQHHRVLVFGGASASATTVLFGNPAPLAPALEDGSGLRCFTRAALEADTAAKIHATGHSVVFKVTRMPAGMSIIDARQQRYTAGCAIVADVWPLRDGHVFVVDIQQKQ